MSDVAILEAKREGRLSLELCWRHGALDDAVRLLRPIRRWEVHSRRKAMRLRSTHYRGRGLAVRAKDADHDYLRGLNRLIAWVVANRGATRP